ncbi:hypothetical protein [Methylocapsa aurea]|uniref:hypothetical protein n=1 Tax=Methylocapsa aurea TaxID=663610 RepID=UPI00056BC39E|nr:hypothetical protein [Methylocapsa aurea]
MADLSKLMKKRLGAPPQLDDTPDNLKAPEVAPAAPAATPRRGEDGRSARRTGRTVQFATRVSEEFDKRFRQVAKRDGLLLAQLLEKSLEAYEKR